MTLGPLAITCSCSSLSCARRRAGGARRSPSGAPVRRCSRRTGRITFADVAGVDEAKEGLAEIVDFLKYPKKYQSLGADSEGVLLLGPPGTGKACPPAQ